MRIQNDYSWVIGCPERGAYMCCHSKNKACCTDTGDINEAWSFDDRKTAVACCEDPVIRKYLNNRKGLGFRVCRVTRRTYVT